VFRFKPIISIAFLVYSTLLFAQDNKQGLMPFFFLVLVLFLISLSLFATTKIELLNQTN